MCNCFCQLMLCRRREISSVCPVSYVSTRQTRRHGGAYRGRAPPTDCLCPPKRKSCTPKRGLCPEEINRLGALERKSRPKLVFFVDLKLEKPLEIPISAGKSLEISVKTFFFFFGGHLFSAGKKHLNFRFRPENPFEFSHYTLLL